MREAAAELLCGQAAVQVANEELMPGGEWLPPTVPSTASCILLVAVALVVVGAPPGRPSLDGIFMNCHVGLLVWYQGLAGEALVCDSRARVSRYVQPILVVVVLIEMLETCRQADQAVNTRLLSRSCRGCPA